MRIPQPKRSRLLVLAAGFIAAALVGLLVGVQIGARAAQGSQERFRRVSAAPAPKATARASVAPHPTILRPSPTAVRTPAPTPRPIVYAPGTVKARIVAAWPGVDAWAIRVTGCESGWDPRQVGAGIAAGHYGLWQFDLPTWREVGGAGNPIDASIEEQTARAWRLFTKPDGGAGRWTCA